MVNHTAWYYTFWNHILNLNSGCGLRTRTPSSLESWSACPQRHQPHSPSSWSSLGSPASCSTPCTGSSALPCSASSCCPPSLLSHRSRSMIGSTRLTRRWLGLFILGLWWGHWATAGRGQSHKGDTGGL